MAMKSHGHLRDTISRCLFTKDHLPLVLDAVSVLLADDEFEGRHSPGIDFPQSVELKPSG